MAKLSQELVEQEGQSHYVDCLAVSVFQPVPAPLIVALNCLFFSPDNSHTAAWFQRFPFAPNDPVECTKVTGCWLDVHHVPCVLIHFGY